MLDLLMGFLGGWGGVAVGGAILAAIGIVLWRVRASGVRAERARREKIDRHARETREEWDDKIARRDPSENREGMKDWLRKEHKL